MTTPTDHNYPSGQPYSPPPADYAWTQLPPPQPTLPDPGVPERRKKSWPARHKIWTGVIAAGVLFVGIGLGTAGGDGGGGKAAPAASDQVVAPRPPAPKPTGTPTPLPVPPKPATTKPSPKPLPPPELTSGQENAVGSAKDYLATSGFSRAGLIQQLSSAYGEGYSKADAVFAVDYLHVNWKEQAVRSAKDYLALDHFSRSGLIQQLSSQYGDGYTRAEATYAADQVGL